MSRSLLLIDDEPEILRALGGVFERQGWDVLRAASGEEGLRSWDVHRPDLVVLDLDLPGISGMDILAVLAPREAVVILLTGHGDVETAVEAMLSGAENFLAKPVEVSHLLAAAERAYEKVELRRNNRLLAGRLAEGRDSATLGTSPRMHEVAREVQLLAASDTTTALLLGESGTGKGWVAQMIHAHGSRSRGPFVEVNCAGLSAAFLDSELFGHEKGAFTDAKAQKRGLFEVADGGTLLLDEVGELDPELQPKLLTVLERRAFRRLGGTREIQVNVRLIAATNRDLSLDVSNGRFREDLFYRLNVLPITIPPLRERSTGDLLELIHRLLAGLIVHHPHGPSRISDRAVERLVGWSWPGNVRELRNVLERALVLGRGSPEITAEHLPPVLRASTRRSPAAPSGAPLTLEEVERHHIERTLMLLDGNRTRTAEALGISRATLHNKLRLYSAGEPPPRD